jgi:hypothetical protein
MVPREHMRQVNYSLTVLQGNMLKLRTLRETTLQHIMPENSGESCCADLALLSWQSVVMTSVC